MTFFFKKLIAVEEYLVQGKVIRRFRGVCYLADGVSLSKRAEQIYRCQLLAVANLTSFGSRHAAQLGMLAFRCINGVAPLSLCQRYSRSITSGVRTRLSGTGVIVSRPRTNALKRTSFYRGQQLWNGLPNEIRALSADLKKLFHSCLKSHLSSLLSSGHIF
eukprot:m.244733 g.244733  ORF g.244733 m.244733 type:complete len:161 (+) comp40247_c1_seq63:48-530(+)